MSHYELTYIIAATVSENEYPNIQKQVTDLLEGKLAGKKTKESSMGRRKLAYPIEKQDHGYYVTVEFDLESDKLKELDKELDLMNSILRHLVVSKKLLTPEEEEARMAKKVKAQAKKQTKEASKEVKKAKPEQKVNLDKLDEKLDQLLEQDIK